jgi:hypothetical protein
LDIVFWVISVYFNIRNTLPKSGTFLLGHPVYLIALKELRKISATKVDNRKFRYTNFLASIIITISSPSQPPTRGC